MQSNLPRLLRGFTTFAIVLLALVTIAIVTMAFVVIGSDEPGSDNLPIPIQFTIDADAYSLTGDSWGTGEITQASGLASFDDPGPRLVVAAGATVVAGILGAFIVLVLLRRIFTTMITGTPFTPANAIRVRWLGIIVIGAAIVEQIIEVGLGLLVLDSVTSSGLDINYRFDLNLGAVFVGLIILALAEVFRHGTSLQADSDLTV